MTVVCLFQSHHLVADLLLLTRGGRTFARDRLDRRPSSRVGHSLVGNRGADRVTSSDFKGFEPLATTPPTVTDR